VIDEEIAKLRSLEPASSEFSVTRNYLDWLTSLPWGQTNPEIYDIPHAQATLDADHHGLQARIFRSRTSFHLRARPARPAGEVVASRAASALLTLSN